MTKTPEQHNANISAVLRSKAIPRDLLYQLLEAAWDIGARRTSTSDTTTSTTGGVS